VKPELTEDRFLDGKLEFLQPKNGYRAATDPVFLAAAVAAKSGQSVLELGCGAGVALGCLLQRAKVDAVGLELQADYAELARENMARNGFSAEIIVGDLAQMPADLRAKSFDHVMMNPPYYESERHTSPTDAGKSTAFLEGDSQIGDWISVGLKRLKPLGWITIIHRTPRLPEIMAALENAGDIRILPLAPRKGRDSARVIVQARKGAAGQLRLLAPLILHEGKVHAKDGEDYSSAARDILRKGNALVMSDR